MSLAFGERGFWGGGSQLFDARRPVVTARPAGWVGGVEAAFKNPLVGELWPAGMESAVVRNGVNRWG